MVTTRKRSKSGQATAEADQLLSGPSTKRRSHLTAKGHSNDIVNLWQEGVAVADLIGDVIDYECAPESSLSIDAPVRCYSIGSSMGKRYSTYRCLMQESQFRYRSSFGGHKSCVNALAISRGQGRYLASGGDGKEIHINDLFVDLRDGAQKVPIAILNGHESNIFSIDWSAENRYLFSTGNDSQVLVYDVEHSQMPTRGAAPTEPQMRSLFGSIGGHDDSVPELSAHPTNPYLLLSCDDSGTLKLLDIRLPHDSVGAARSDIAAGFSSVKWNPSASDGNTFAAATCGRLTGSTRLYDVRQCFSGDTNRPLTSKDAVLNFHTNLLQNSSTRGLVGAAAETNSLCFDPQGRFLASSISRYHPTIYAVNDPDPLATLQSTVVEERIDDGYCQWLGLPAGSPAAPKKLSSCCTIKHGSFGLESHTGRLHYAIGSDDFRAYIFEIPDRAVLERQREFITREAWLHSTSQLHREAAPRSQRQASQPKEASDDMDSDTDSITEDQIDRESEVAYCAGSLQRGNSIVRPARIQQQAYVLCGGRSILNTALIHPTMPLVFTSGITSDIGIHSAAPLHAKDLYTEHTFDSDGDVRVGGTRPRMLLQPKLKFYRNSDSELSSNESGDEDEDEDDEEEGSGSSLAENEEPIGHEDSSDDPQHSLRDDLREAERDASDSGQATRAAEQSNREEQPSGTVEDFLANMRTDPLFSTASTLDYQYDRHIGTYSLSHLSPGVVSADSSSPPSSAPTVASVSDAGEGANTDVTSEGSHSTDDNENLDDDDDDDLEDDSDIDWTDFRYQNDGYGDPDLLDYEYQERLDDDLRHAFQPEDEFKDSRHGEMWAMVRAMRYSDREQKRMRLFDDLLNQDEKTHLTAEFRKIPKVTEAVDGQPWR